MRHHGAEVSCEKMQLLCLTLRFAPAKGIEGYCVNMAHSTMTGHAYMLPGRQRPELQCGKSCTTINSIANRSA